MRSLPSIALATLLAAAPAAALGPVAFGPDLEARGWQALTFRGRTPAEFSAEGPETLRVKTEQGVSVLWMPLPDSFRDGSQAAWQWRVDAGVPPTDLARSGADDRSLALYFLFSDDPDGLQSPPSSLREALRSGRALLYVWGGDAPRRSVVESPTLRGRGLMVVQRPAGSPNGQWQPESVNLRDDFRTAFGREPGALVGIAVSADSDDTEVVSDASLTGLVIR